MKTNFKILLFLILILSSCEKEVENPSADALACDFFEIDRILVDDPDKEVDYIINCVMDVYGNVVVEPGVVIHFEDGSGLYVRSSGSFNASGNANNPIVLSSKSKTKGAWKGLIFESAGTQNKLIHTKLEYAGGGSFNSNNDLGAIILWDGAKLNIENTSITNSASHGLNASYRNADFTIINSNINQCSKAPILISPQYMSALGASNDLSGNTENFVHIDLKDVDIEGDHTILNPSIPFRVFPYNAFQTNIRIISGTTTFFSAIQYAPIIIEFEDGTGIYVDDAGTLQTIAEGDQMLFTAVNKTPGAWNGIYYQFTQGDNKLENAIIEYAGAEFDGENGGIQMWGDPKLAINDVEFRNILGCAIVDRPKGTNDPQNPNLSLGSLLTYSNISESDYCKK